MEKCETIDELLRKNLIPEQLRIFNRIHYGREDHCEIKLKKASVAAAAVDNFEVLTSSFHAVEEELRAPRLVKLGLIQNASVLPAAKPIKDQREAIFKRVERIINVAASEGVNILCLQETWSMPFFLCTKEKKIWEDFAESAEAGPSIIFLSKLAVQHKMVIISPILENDNGVWWNTAVVIDDTGRVMGKHRKNHLPSTGSFSETSYYSSGNLGHPVFNTKYGKIAVNICYGRHHALNWLMFAINGAEIVFNPCATIGEFGEAFWGVEARNAAVANGYYTCSINRVGTENFSVKSSAEKTVSRIYYGSSYVSAPNGYRTRSLSKVKDGLLIVNVDLNLCRQVRDQWGFNMTARLQDYAKELLAIKPL